MAPLTFHTEERLKSHITISRLFREGQSFSIYPLRVVWLLVESEDNKYPAQFAVSVPKKSFKKAVDRNRLKRKIREAYRLNKNEFYTQLPKSPDLSTHQLAIMIIYVAKETKPYFEIEQAMVKLLQRLTIKAKK